MVLCHRLVPYLSGGQGIPLKSSLVVVWVPFIASDLGNFFGGPPPVIWSSAAGRLARGERRWLYSAASVCWSSFLPFSHSSCAIIALFAVATFSYAAFSTIANVLPSDLFKIESVASVSGMSGTGAGIGTIIAFKLIGYFSDAHQTAGTHSFDPIVIVAGMIPFLAMVLVLFLVRNPEPRKRGWFGRFDRVFSSSL